MNGIGTETSMPILCIHVNSQLIPLRSEGKQGGDRPHKAPSHGCNFIADTIDCPLENQEQEMPSHRFTHCLLTEGIKAMTEWRTSLFQPEAFAALREGVGRRFENLDRSHSPNEAHTEQELIHPVLKLLGWNPATSQSVLCPA